MNTPKKDFSFWLGALHLFTLFVFSVSQPLFELLSRHPQYFIAQGSEPIDVYLLTVFLCVVIPSLIVFLEWLFKWFSLKKYRWTHAFLISCLFSVFIMQALKSFQDVPGPAILSLSIALGGAAGIGYVRFYEIRTFFTFLSPAVFIFPGLFLFHSPVLNVLSTEHSPEVTSTAIHSKIPVFIIVFDEFALPPIMDGKHRIDPLRFPNLSELARESYWAPYATTVALDTLKSIPSILTGKYPPATEIATYSKFPENLFTFLGGTYDIRAIESVTRLCPTTLCGENKTGVERMGLLMADLSFIFLHLVLPQDYTNALPDIQKNWHVVNPFQTRFRIELRKDRAYLFQQFLDSIQVQKQPALYFLHILLPHLPYQYLPSGKVYPAVPIEDMVGKRWVDEAVPVYLNYQRYLLQLGFVDGLIGKFIDRLKTLGLYHHSLIIITADHGVSFHPGDNRRYLTHTNSLDLLSVPLLIKVPNQKTGVTIENNIQTIDILPTISDVLESPLPWQADGQSVFDQALRTQKKRISPNLSTHLALYKKEMKNTVENNLYILGSVSGQLGLTQITPHPELLGLHENQLTLDLTADYRVKFRVPSSKVFVDSEAGVVPAMIVGTLTSDEPIPGSLSLAVSVNGIIRSVIRSFQTQGRQTEFSLMVPESSFHHGENVIRVFVVSLDPDRDMILQAVQ